MLLVVTLLGAVAACGDSGSDPASRQELVTSIEPSCAQLGEELARVPPVTRSNALGRRLEQAARALSRHLTELEGLRPSDADRAALTRYIAEVREAALLAARLNQAQRQPIPGIGAVNREAARVAGRMHAAAAHLGLDRCLQAAALARSRLRIYVP